MKQDCQKLKDRFNVDLKKKNCFFPKRTEWNGFEIYSNGWSTIEESFVYKKY